jgi:hypothetical protein
MRRRSSDQNESLFSPAVDVLANTVLIMFIYSILFLITKGQDPDPLTLANCPLPPIVAGFPFDYTQPTSGGLGKKTFELVAGELPKGLSLDPKTGRIAGLVFSDVLPGKYEVTLGAKDKTGAPVTTLEFVVWQSIVPVNLDQLKLRLLRDDSNLPLARVGSPYEAIIGSNGGVGEIQWQIVGGNLPAEVGLVLRDGKLEGEPVQAGLFTFTVEAECKAGSLEIHDRLTEWPHAADRREYRIEILPAMNGNSLWPLVRMGDSCCAGFVERLLSGEVVEYENIPPGMQVHENGALFGTPTAPGEYMVKFKAVRENRELVKGEGVLRVLTELEPPQAFQFLQTTREGDKPFHVSVPTRGLIEPIAIEPLKPLPEGIKLVGTELNVTPVKIGTQQIPLQLTDARGTKVTMDFFLRTLPRKRALTLNTPDVLDVIVGREFALPIAVTGGEEQPEIELVGDLPGVELVAAILRGKATHPGQWNVVLKAKETRETAEKKLTLRANYGSTKSLSILTTQLPTALLDKAYHVTLAAEGAVGELRWQHDGKLFPGLTFEEGVIAGTPTMEGQNTLTVSLEDESGQKVERALTITCRRLDESQLQVITRELPTVAIGQSYVADFAAEGGIGGYRWQLDGELPDGLEFREGRISGVPVSGAGSEFFLTLKVSDETGQWSQPQELTLPVVELTPLAPLSMETSNLPIAVVEKAYRLSLATAGAVGDVDWQTIGELPPGMLIQKGVIIGTPTVQGTFRFQLVCQDALMRTTSPRELELEVLAASSGSAAPSLPNSVDSEPDVANWKSLIRRLTPEWVLALLVLNIFSLLSLLFLSWKTLSANRRQLHNLQAK